MQKRTKTQINLKKFKRINNKSLRQLLLYRFLNHYGYDKGEVSAKAIVDDIIRLVQRYFVLAKPENEGTYINYGKLAWMAVDIDDRPKRGHSMATTKLKPVLLTFLADEDVQSLKKGFSSRRLRITRMVRWCQEAYDQGALLSQLDLAVLLNVCDAVVSDYVNEYQNTTGTILPTRGNIHDLSGAITHKREIISLYLQGYLTPAIAKKTNHSKEAVDRYIRDFEAVRTVFSHGITTLDTIAHITHLSKRVVQQYLDLIPKKKTIDERKERDYITTKSKTLSCSLQL
jgi:predicted transcriptional regulator